MENVLTTGGDIFVWIVAILFGALAGLTLTDWLKIKSKGSDDDKEEAHGH